MKSVPCGKLVIAKAEYLICIKTKTFKPLTIHEMRLLEHVLARFCVEDDFIVLSWCACVTFLFYFYTRVGYIRLFNLLCLRFDLSSCSVSIPNIAIYTPPPPQILTSDLTRYGNLHSYSCMYGVFAMEKCSKYGSVSISVQRVLPTTTAVYSPILPWSAVWVPFQLFCARLLARNLLLFCL